MITQKEQALNIKDLVIEEQKILDPSAPFSLERDVDENTYQEMVKFVKSRFMLRWGVETGETACMLYNLFPERENDFIDSELADTLNDWARAGDSYYLRHKYFLKTVFPDVYELFPVSDQACESRLRDINNQIEVDIAFALEFEDLIHIKTLKPDIVVPQEGLAGFVDKYNSEDFGYIEYAVALKILAPESFEKLNITKEFWTKNRKKLNEYKSNKNWLNFIKLATKLNIVAAKEVKFDQGNMVIVPQTNLDTTDTAPLPETRSF